ncbi:hypothetical protein CHUAL_008988 [Chamberlinius hualienensis]
MAPMWFKYRTIKVAEKNLYKQAVVINGNVYLLGYESFQFHRYIKHNGIISKMDLETFETVEFMPIDDHAGVEYGGFSNMCVYGPHIMLLVYRHDKEQYKLLMINTITKQVDNLLLNNNIQYETFVDLCVIKDHLYIIFHEWLRRKLSVLDINLNTFEKRGTFYGAPNRHLNRRLKLAGVPIEVGEDMQIYFLNLNPSLKSLCAARILELNLDQSKLPKKLQDELKRYIK